MPVPQCLGQVLHLGTRAGLVAPISHVACVEKKAYTGCVEVTYAWL